MANPGRGWICVQAESLSESSIMDSIKTGDFYASTGIDLDELVNFNNTINISIRTEDEDPLNLPEYITTITGYEGKILHQTDSLNLNYQLPKNAHYARATVKSSEGFKAWTQPIFRT